MYTPRNLWKPWFSEVPFILSEKGGRIKRYTIGRASVI
jgi:hypothetical protein